VRDLAGNVSEWMLDGFQGASDPYWNARGVLADPRCDVPKDDGFGPTRSIRGGAWFLGISELASSRRSNAVSVAFSIDTGFRCSRPGR
jgi:formylglycine-generating enzyme required for sulfatase activity